MGYINCNSIVNQRIKQDFVNREVYACISDFADYLFGYYDELDRYASYDEFSNYCAKKCDKCGCVNTIYPKHDGDDILYVCSECGTALSEDEYNDLEEEFQEVYEWWIVSPWLGEKLEERGEVVMERIGGWIWGRKTTGQSISLDSVISNICLHYGLLQERDD